MDNIGSEVSEDTLVNYWETIGQDWDIEMAAEHGATLSCVLQAARLDLDAANQTQLRGFSVNANTISRKFVMSDRSLVVLQASIFPDQQHLEFMFDDGSACLYVPGTENEDENVCFSWSSGKYRVFGLEGEEESHSYGVDGFMLETNRQKLAAVLTEIGQLLA